MEREVGGGIGVGTHVNPWLIHVNVWQKPLQYCKVICLQLIKINGKEKKNKVDVSTKKKKVYFRSPYLLFLHHPNHCWDIEGVEFIRAQHHTGDKTNKSKHNFYFLE